MAQKLRPQAETLSGSPQPNFVGYSTAPILAKRAPTTTDTGYPLGQIWVDKTGDDMYGLVDVSAGSATWNLLAASPGEIATLTGDTGGAISPSAGNINLLGTSEQIDTTGSGDTITFSIPDTFTVGDTAGNSTVTIEAGSGGMELNVGNGGFLSLSSDTGDMVISGDVVDTTVYVGLASGACDKTVTVGNNKSTSTTTIYAGTGGLSLDTTDTNGAIVIKSGTGAMSISADAAATTLNVGTGAAAKTVTLGSTNTTSTTTVQSGSGGVAITGTNGAITINSGTGALGISTDAAATTISIGTGAAAKTITIGSTNTTSATNLTAGSGGVNCATDFALTSVATKILMNGGAATDFIGTATLTNGTVTVANTNIAATDRILVTRSAVNASTALGLFKVVKTASTNFVITACKPADATTETGDASTVDYIIVRQT